MAKKINDKKIKNNKTREVIPLRDTIILPYTVTPLLVGREQSLNAAEHALVEENKIICVSQKRSTEGDIDPKAEDLYRVGTLCTILQVLKLPDGNMRLLVEGDKRVDIQRYFRNKKYLKASYKINNKVIDKEDVEIEALLRVVKKSLVKYVKLNKSIPKEALMPIDESSNAEEFFYFSLANVQFEVNIKQKIFEIDDLFESIKTIYSKLNEEVQILQLENKIDNTVKTKLNKMQKEYYLTEQLKAINQELGVSKEDKSDVLDFKEKIKKVNLNDEARTKAEEEIKKLARLNSYSPEYSVVYNYLTWILDIPWDESKLKDFELKDAQKILDDDHYGLKKVKERILEYLAVVKLAKKMKGQILCFVGPPGVGKTSLGKSIARSMDRKFVRLSLGGVRDEAEIRGHRRTYVGALPGVIIQSMKKAGTRSPLIMMDEVDKMSSDFRGDPTSALLEVLDPEQNFSFRDHYLDFEYDLSQVIFITTANTLSSIPRPLIDRMEIIEIPGYTSYEKKHIAVKHLIPKVIKEHEVEDKIELNYQDKTIESIIESYTREAGVRDLERKIATILRKAVKDLLEKKAKKKNLIKPKDLEKYLGVPKHLYSEVNRKDSKGIATGLAWTKYGGETLQVEVVKVKGKGKLKLTGKLGDVMQESAQAAHSYARLHAKRYGFKEDFYKDCDIHVHIPEGAIPKDGPSAGVTMVTALVSILSGKKIRHDIAMTGEITLSGKVLPIGGLAEKLIAAKRAKIKNVLIPKKNQPHLTEVNDEIKKDMNVIFVDSIEEVLDESLLD